MLSQFIDNTQEKRETKLSAAKGNKYYLTYTRGIIVNSTEHVF